MLTFSAERHEYFFNGVRVPNVTSVLDDLTDYSMVGEEKMRVAREKGKAVHSMVELDCRGELNESPWDEEKKTGLPDWMRPVLIEWREFVSQSGFRVIDSEKRVYDPRFRYAGTLDLFGEMRAGFAYIDIKRSFMAGRAIGLQLAGYQQADAHTHHERRVAKRYALRLKDGESYRMREFTDPNDFNVFTACLVRHQWRGKQ